MTWSAEYSTFGIGNPAANSGAGGISERTIQDRPNATTTGTIDFIAFPLLPHDGRSENDDWMRGTGIRSQPEEVLGTGAP